MTTLTLCERCGALAPQGVLSGYCATCAPDPADLELRWEEVDKRHIEAAQAAKDGVTVPKRRPHKPAERVRRPASWRVVSDKAIPHLFSPGSGVVRSLCGIAFERGRSTTPPPGERGCRRCALAAGWISSLSESVTT